VSTEGVRHYDEQSGDFNPMHFDNEVARKHRSTCHTPRGMLSNGWFTHLLKIGSPGQVRSTYAAPVSISFRSTLTRRTRQGLYTTYNPSVTPTVFGAVFPRRWTSRRHPLRRCSESSVPVNSCR
jgi:hypothetical protein